MKKETLQQINKQVMLILSVIPMLIIGVLAFIDMSALIWKVDLKWTDKAINTIKKIFKIKEEGK